jgi:hypothetical protein
MGLFGAMRAVRLGAALLALAAPWVAAAQLDLRAYDEQQRQILDKIHEIQSQDGPYSAELLEQLTGLIVLYREGDDQSLALVAIERALQVVRANSGLYSLEQVPLIWLRIEAEEARGNDAAVWDLEQDLLKLVRRHPDDLRAAPILHQMADRQMAVLDRVLDGETPPQVKLGCFYKPWPNDEAGSCEAGSRKDVVQGMLAEAQRSYADAIAILLRNEEYTSDELLELEMELLRGAELIRSEYEHERRGITGSRILTRRELPVPLAPMAMAAEIREPWRSRTAPVRALAEWDLPYDTAEADEQDFLHEYETRVRRLRDPYHRGRQSLRRLYAYGAATSSSPLRQATTLALMADWDLLHSHHGFAVDGYELARALLEQAGEPQASVVQLFAPPTPVVLPAFQPNPLAKDETRPATGRIDVAFTITKYGRGRDIELRGVENATDAATSDLIGLLKNSRFRPRLTGGQFAESPVVVRYYVYD